MLVKLRSRNPKAEAQDDAKKSEAPTPSAPGPPTSGSPAPAPATPMRLGSAAKKDERKSADPALEKLDLFGKKYAKKAARSPVIKAAVRGPLSLAATASAERDGGRGNELLQNLGRLDRSMERFPFMHGARTQEAFGYLNDLRIWLKLFSFLPTPTLLTLSRACKHMALLVHYGFLTLLQPHISQVAAGEGESFRSDLDFASYVITAILTKRLNPMQRRDYKPVLLEMAKNMRSHPLHPSQSKTEIFLSFDDLEPRHIAQCQHSRPQRHTCSPKLALTSPIYCDWITFGDFLAELSRRARAGTYAPTARVAPIRGQSAAMNESMSGKRDLYTLRTEPDELDCNLSFSRDMSENRSVDADFSILVFEHFLLALLKIIIHKYAGRAMIRKIEFLCNLNHRLFHRVWLQICFGWPAEIDDSGGAIKKKAPRRISARGSSRHSSSKESLASCESHFYFTICDHFSWIGA